MIILKQDFKGLNDEGYYQIMYCMFDTEKGLLNSLRFADIDFSIEQGLSKYNATYTNIFKLNDLI